MCQRSPRRCVLYRIAGRVRLQKRNQRISETTRLQSSARAVINRRAPKSYCASIFSACAFWCYMYAGGFLHADDIRTLASTTTTLEMQISTVKKFIDVNFLNLNASKCEFVAFKKSSITTNQESIEVDDCSFPIRGEATCLGYQWKQDLSSSPAIQNRIQRA